MKRSVIIVAAGESSRFKQDKLFFDYLGKPLIRYTFDAAKNACDNVVIVANKSNADKMRQLSDGQATVVCGGATRSESVRKGLESLPVGTEIVAIHDGARPFATPDLFERAFLHAEKYGSAIPVTPVTDSLYDVGKSLPVPRENLSAAQTPQAFDLAKLKNAYDLATSPLTDDGQVWLNAYGSLHFIEGETGNKKVTYPSDLPTYRIGIGFDAHRLGENRKLILCGVPVPFNLGLIGHSDADVALHALIDAILSAIGEKDIGNLFPDTDDTYLGIDSGLLLDEVRKKARKNGYEVVNVSIVIMAQAPRLSPYIEKMRENVAERLDCAVSRVNVSATTTENLGITAEGLGMASQAQVLLIKRD